MSVSIAFLCFKPVNNACPCPSRQWVAAVGNFWFKPTNTPVALQIVCCCSLLCFNPIDNTCCWLTSKWVPVVAWCVSGPLMALVLGSSVGEWLPCLSGFPVCWCLSYSLECELLSVDTTPPFLWSHPWPTSMYVCAPLSSLLISLSLVSQFVSAFFTFMKQQSYYLYKTRHVMSLPTIHNVLSSYYISLFTWLLTYTSLAHHFHQF